MTQFLILNVLLCVAVLTYSQDSIAPKTVAFNYSRVIEGTNLNYNHCNLSLGWERKKCNFNLDAGVIHGKSLFNKYSRTVYYDAFEEYYRSEVEHIYQTAEVRYNYGTFRIAINWNIIERTNFALAIGPFVQMEIYFGDKESNHQTQTRAVYSSNWNPSGTEVWSETNEEFNALNFKESNVAAGLRLSPKYTFNKWFLQLNIDAGVNEMQRIVKNSDCINGCITDNYRTVGDDRPLFVAFGLSVGCELN